MIIKPKWMSDHRFCTLTGECVSVTYDLWFSIFSYRSDGVQLFRNTYKPEYSDELHRSWWVSALISLAARRRSLVSQTNAVLEKQILTPHFHFQELFFTAKSSYSGRLLGNTIRQHQSQELSYPAVGSHEHQGATYSHGDALLQEALSGRQLSLIGCPLYFIKTHQVGVSCSVVSGFITG